MRLSWQLVLNRLGRCVFYSLAFLTIVPLSTAQGLVSSDLSRLRNVGSVAVSPDAHRVAYTVVMRDRPGRPYGQLWIMDLATQKSIRVGGEKDSGGPLWSPNGKWLAFQGRQGDKHGLFMSRPDGSDITFLAPLHDTNSPLPGTGKDVTWSPDDKELAFISSTPGAEAAEASGDPMVITRYLYKPDACEGMTRFNDSKRLHIIVVDVSSKQIRQLTQGNTDEHSSDWSPDGKELLFVSNREPNQDEFFNYDIFALRVADNGIRRLTATESNEYDPLWSPDGKRIVYRGTRRGLTDRETTMDGTLAYGFASPRDMSELYLKAGNAAPRKLTDLNAQLLSGKQITEVESFTFVSNDNKFEVEAFLTKPLGITATSKHPLNVNIHGGPHGQNGPSFNFKNQVYAARGWATLNVNYRGSSGYGQKFADAVFGDQDGNEGQDVLYGVSAAVRRYLWIDRERMGIEGVSYGGQLTDWLITQTNEFKAAVPLAGIANLVSYNYMTYYNQYEEMEFGQFLHQGNLMDVAWERSALKQVARAHTPTMLMHGENDNDVPIAEAEQFFIALKDVGTEAVFVRYPREGHGLSETGHVIDSTDRCLAWYEKHFPKPGAEGVTNVQP